MNGRIMPEHVGPKFNRADHLINHLPVELRRIIVERTHKMYPYSADKIWLDAEGKLIFPHGGFKASMNVSGTQSPMALAEMIVHAVGWLLRNDLRFLDGLTQAFQPERDPADVDDEPLMMMPHPVEGLITRPYTYQPPKRNPDGSRPATESDWSPYAPRVGQPI